VRRNADSVVLSFFSGTNSLGHVAPISFPQARFARRCELPVIKTLLVSRQLASSILPFMRPLGARERLGT